MENKYQKLIQILVKESRPVTSKELAYSLNVSTRTIRNYVKMINCQQNNKIITSSNLGYMIDKQKIEKYLNEFNNSLPGGKEERICYIIKKLLRNREHSIDLYDISDEIAISLETLKGDMVRVKEILIENNIYTNQNNEIISIEGSEKDKRKLLGKLLSGELNKNLLNINTLSSIFPECDLNKMASFLGELFSKHHYLVNDYALLNMILEISIEIERIKKGFIQSERHAFITTFSKNEKKLINAISSEIEKDYNIQYSKSEKVVLANIVLSNITKSDYLKLDIMQLKHTLDSSSFKLVNKLISQMNDWELFDLNNEKFLIKFSLHIQSLLQRIEGENVIRNPLVNQLKQSCPLVFEHAVEIAYTISHFTGKKVSEDEVGFLALHLGSIMGETAYLQDRIKATLFLPNYHDLSFEIIDKIEDDFGDELAVTQIISSVENVVHSQAQEDLLINVGPFLNQVSIQEIQITPLYTKKDRKTIRESLDKIKLHRKRNYLHKQLKSLTSRELFFRIDQQVSKYQVINFMCDSLVQLGVVSETYCEEVFMRERQSSTAFGRVAVPHSINMNAKENALVILISEKGIQWDSNSVVNIVLLFSVKKTERSLFFNVFDSIVTTLVNPTAFQNIIESKRLEDLIEIFLAHVDDFEGKKK